MSLVNILVDAGRVVGFLAMIDPDPTTRAVFSALATGASELPEAIGDIDRLRSDLAPATAQFKTALAVVQAKHEAGRGLEPGDLDELADGSSAVIGHPSLQAVLATRDQALRGTGDE